MVNNKELIRYGSLLDQETVMPIEKGTPDSYKHNKKWNQKNAGIENILALRGDIPKNYDGVAGNAAVDFANIDKAPVRTPKRLPCPPARSMAIISFLIIMKMIFLHQTIRILILSHRSEIIGCK